MVIVIVIVGGRAFCVNVMAHVWEKSKLSPNFCGHIHQIRFVVVCVFYLVSLVAVVFTCDGAGETELCSYFCFSFCQLVNDSASKLLLVVNLHFGPL